MKEIAIIGPTASGKSDLAIEVAKECNAIILSLDSLSIYKEIDIVSAKPSKDELKQIKHFGINEIYPNEHFSVDIFIKIYKKAKEYAKKYGKNLIIVGGSSFYLKTLIEGISPLPNISQEIKEKVKYILKDLKSAYELLKDIDEKFAKKISSYDKYRIQKALEIYFSTNLPPSIYFIKNPKKPIIKNLDIYEIGIDRDKLKENILKRTKKMLDLGLIDEIAYLEKKYGRDLNPMKAIGIKETLFYLDGFIDKDELIKKISLNTYHLAKRQITFNKTQFTKKIVENKERLRDTILKNFC
ncbi:tRNA (adenosine(37)-N6)-dimethylallyltransferase MiaA [Nitrosophilus kaiyonis]|uniref:tRNA (adenosine(37)-N6)-dimethylallyltransferase MiaA n=1 Tax=Nitrosophilus kaiyonis TaxID=2930200 RepID=UPI0024912364|nr:tRNA (adenosine(37)-N6)-dimethylallyltransferase MiaA [Nitrosophilus kaiyonis]